MSDIKGLLEFFGFDILLIGFITLFASHVAHFLWQHPPSKWAQAGTESWKTVAEYKKSATMVAILLAAFAGAVLNLAADEITDSSPAMQWLTYSIEVSDPSSSDGDGPLAALKII